MLNFRSSFAPLYYITVSSSIPFQRVFREGIKQQNFQVDLGKFDFGPKIVRKKKKTPWFIVFMSLLTVAYQRGSGEFIRFTADHGGGDDGGDGYRHDGDGGGGSGGSPGLSFNQGMQQGEVTMQGGSLVSGYNRGDPEFRQMVSALTHVVSSGSDHRSTEWMQQSGYPMMSGFGHAPSSLSRFSSSPSSGPSGVGQKRGREEQETDNISSSHNLMQQQTTPRLFRTTLGHFVLPSQGDSSSGATTSLHHILKFSIKHVLHI